MAFVSVPDPPSLTKVSGVLQAAAESSRPHLFVNNACELYTESQRRWFLALLFVVATSSYLDYFIISVVLEPIKSEFHVSDTMLGVLTGTCFALVYAFTAIPITHWADRGNRSTVISLALLAWSSLTAICGCAQSFAQLALARFGVGAVEPGAMPPALSLVADYFPASRRATAVAVLTNGASAIGWLAGVGIGGWVAGRYGWRAAFWAAGIPGIGLAVLAKRFLPEPRRQFVLFPQPRRRESALLSLRKLVKKRSFFLTLVGFCVYAIFGYGTMVFIPTFLIRSMHATLAMFSLPWGGAIAASNCLGALLGGYLADRLSRHDPRWYLWLPVIACLVGPPLYVVAFCLSSVNAFIGVEFVAELVLSMGVPLISVAVLSVCGATRRALAMATVNCLTLLIGGSIGPLLVGALSDVLRITYGLDSLRIALLIICAFPLPAALLLWCASRSMREDTEDSMSEGDA